MDGEVAPEGAVVVPKIVVQVYCVDCLAFHDASGLRGQNASRQAQKRPPRSRSGRPKRSVEILFFGWMNRASLPRLCRRSAPLLARQAGCRVRSTLTLLDASCPGLAKPNPSRKNWPKPKLKPSTMQDVLVDSCVINSRICSRRRAIRGRFCPGLSVSPVHGSAGSRLILQWNRPPPAPTLIPPHGSRRPCRAPRFPLGNQLPSRRETSQLQDHRS